MTTLDYYIHATPTAQNAVDIFKDAWSTSFPPPFEHLRASSLT